MNIGEQIRGLRKSRGYTQEQLAEILEVSRQAVSKWEAGQAVPEVDKLLAISRHFGVSVDAIISDNSIVEDNAPFTQQNTALLFWAALAFMALGNLVAWIGWMHWHTILPVGIGMALILLGCILYEALRLSGTEPAARKKLRREFYRVACWLVLPIPVVLFVSTAFRYYPREYYYWQQQLATGLSYFMLCAAATFLLRKK